MGLETRDIVISLSVLGTVSTAVPVSGTYSRLWNTSRLFVFALGFKQDAEQRFKPFMKLSLTTQNNPEGLLVGQVGLETRL